MSVRRPVSLYVPTVITGISWKQGAKYSSDEAKTVLGTDGGASRTDGIEIAFSRPVYAQTLTDGVIDLLRIQGGRGLRGVISSVEGAYVDKPDSGLIESVKYRDESGETLNRGDRLVIVVRSCFILDQCCRPLDGCHVGGKVPQLPDYADEDEDGEPGKDEPEEVCPHPPRANIPWTSGNGVPGGNFESWFFVD
jgi:hypothetical protein